MVEIILKFILFVFTVIYFALEGYREGWYWYYSCIKPLYSKEPKSNIHIDFTIQRIIFISLISMIMFDILYIIGLFCIIPLIHNGAYYMTRQEIDETYKNGIKSQSITSTSWLTKYFTPKNRFVLFIIGIILICLSCIKF